jgi:hypothetical protein
MSERLDQNPEEVDFNRTLKIIAGLGIVAGAAALEAIGIKSDDPNFYISAPILAGAGGFYALRQFPKSTRQMVGNTFGIPFLDRKED